MVRLIGAPALALTLMTAASPAAYAAHRYHHAGPDYRQVHHAGISRATHRSAAADRHHARRRYAAAPAFSDRQDVRAQRPARRYAPNQETVEYRRPFRPANQRERYDRPRVAGGRPRAWCGWYARSLVGHDPGPTFNLARNWTRWGHAASPGVGVMVVWAHHVGMITGRTANGGWIVKSGNDGHAVRERPRSLAGAIAFRAS